MPSNLQNKRSALARIISMMSKWDVTIKDLVKEYNRILNIKKGGE